MSANVNKSASLLRSVHSSTRGLLGFPANPMRRSPGPLLAIRRGMRPSPPAILVLLFGCAPYVHSPSVRSFPLEAAKALNPRETGIQVEGGGGGGEYVNLGGISVRVRHGLAKGLDGSVEGNFQRFNITDEDYALQNRNIFAGRLGIKYAFIDHVALAVGFGGGGWTGGGFIGPDASLIFGYENPYCVPFVDIGGFMSLPVRENVIALIDRGSEPEDFITAPTNTVGWTIGTGLRIPVSHKKNQETKSAFLLGFRYRGVYFDNVPAGYRDRRSYIYGSGAFEYVFGRGQ